MAKIFVLCVTLAALVVIADSKSLSHPEDCLDCPEYVGVEEKAYRRPKRDHEGLKFAKELTLGIIGGTFEGVAELNRIKMAPRNRPIIIGPGTGNTNRVMFNNRNDDYNDGYNGGNNFNYRNQGNYNY